MSNDNPKTLISAVGTLHWQGFKKEFLSSEASSEAPIDDKPGQGKQVKAKAESKINVETDLKVEPADVDKKDVDNKRNKVNGVPGPVEIQQNEGETK
jgi:hypothetical protein